MYQSLTQIIFFWEGTILEFMKECGEITIAGEKEFAKISSPSISDF